MCIFILVFRLFYTKIRIKIHKSTTSVILSVSMCKIRIKKLTYYKSYDFPNVSLGLSPSQAWSLPYNLSLGYEILKTMDCTQAASKF